MPDDEAEQPVGDDAAIVEVAADGVATYRASGLYSCFNALLMARLGYEGKAAPAWLQQRFNAGHDHEPLILNRLDHDYGFYVTSRQAEAVLPVGRWARVLGHVDALHTFDTNFPVSVTHVNGDGTDTTSRYFDPPDDTLAVIDAKALSQSSYETWSKKRFAAFPYYAWQQRAYMLGLGASYLVMAVKNKNTDAMSVEVFDEEYMDQIVTHADLLRKVASVELAAARGATSIFDTPCTPMFPCPYFHMHPPDQRKPSGDVDEEAVRVLGAQRQDANARLSAAKTEVDALNAQIIAAIGKDPASVITDEFTVSTYYSGYSPVDWGALSLALGLTESEAKAAYIKAAKSDKLSVRITPKKEK